MESFNHYIEATKSIKFSEFSSQSACLIGKCICKGNYISENKLSIIKKLQNLYEENRLNDATYYFISNLIKNNYHNLETILNDLKDCNSEEKIIGVLSDHEERKYIKIAYDVHSKGPLIYINEEIKKLGLSPESACLFSYLSSSRGILDNDIANKIVEYNKRMIYRRSNNENHLFLSKIFKNAPTTLLNFNEEIPSSNKKIPSFNKEIPSFNKKIPSFNKNIPSSNKEIPSFDNKIPSFNKKFPKLKSRYLNFSSLTPNPYNRRHDSYSEFRTFYTEDRNKATPLRGFLEGSPDKFCFKGFRNT